MQPHILVVTGSRNLKRHVTRALASAGFGVRSCMFQRAELAEELTLGPHLCVIDVDEREEEVSWLVDTIRARHPEVTVLFVSHDHEMPFLRKRLATRNLSFLIAKHGGVVGTTSDIIDETELIVTSQKLVRRDIFGLDKYLTTWGIKIHEEEVDGTSAKPRIIDRLEDFLDEIDCYGAVKNAVLLVADELMMNAIFDAPRDAAGKPRYATRDRGRPLMLEPSERAVFRFACDGRHIGLSVSDRFGALSRDVILRYLECCFDGGPPAMQSSAGGAGLGLYMIFNSITQLVFNIQAGVATEVIAMFYARSGPLAFKTSGRSLNLFYLE